MKRIKLQSEKKKKKVKQEPLEPLEFKRSVDNRQCERPQCASRHIASKHDVVVAIVDVSLTKRVLKQKKVACEWHNGRMYFHDACWNALCAAVNDDGTASEKRLLKSATMERHDGKRKFDDSVRRAVDLLRDAKHVLAFTGAGVSVSSGIPDYRGTGGVDTKEDLAQESTESTEEVDYLALRPTRAHRVLRAMFDAGRLQHCVTQNCDGLHERSGLPMEKVTALHGCVFIEYCEDCKREYWRDYCVDEWSTDVYNEPWFVRCPSCTHNHYTSRHCDDCNGKLRDTIVNFGDQLHDKVCGGGLDLAIAEARRADVCVCLGSSLMVTPASTLPKMSKHLIICNLQATELDSNADVVVHAETDLFMDAIWNGLN